MCEKLIEMTGGDDIVREAPNVKALAAAPETEEEKGNALNQHISRKIGRMVQEDLIELLDDYEKGGGQVEMRDSHCLKELARLWPQTFQQGMSKLSLAYLRRGDWSSFFQAEGDKLSPVLMDYSC